MRIDKPVFPAQTGQASPARTSGHAGTSGTDAAADAKLKEACQGMEAVFLNMLLTRMRATVPKSTLFGNRSKEETMQTMLDGELSANLAKAGGTGLAESLYQQLKPKK